MFYHSVLSDWNHGNAHFLRGIASQLVARGHDVQIYEPRDAWSLQNLIAEQGEAAVVKFRAIYPDLTAVQYDLDSLDLRQVLAATDLVLVHEWNNQELVARIGRHRRDQGDYCLLFHDTHHRSVTAPESMSNFDLRDYDGVLAYGASIRDVYLRNRWSSNVWVWHEAADTRVFYPRVDSEAAHTERRGGTANANANANANGNRTRSYDGDLVWIGNWGDEERAAEIHEFLISPVRDLGLRARVYGVRYPASAIKALGDAGIEYAGWLPNFDVPNVFSRFRLTVHIPRRPYVEALPGIPTIRPFEALACGIPMVSAYWHDRENLFTPGRDYLVAHDGQTMKGHIRALLDNPPRAQELAEHGRQTILQRHTCAHRTEALLSIYRRSHVHAQGVPA
jgi:spore maturation protein CgeB